MTHASSRRLRILLLVGVSVLLIALAGVAVAGNNGGSGLSFTPIQFVQIAETSSVQHLGWTGYTLEAWVYPTDATGIRSIIRNNNDYNFWIDGGAVRSQVFPGGDGTSAFTNTISSGGIVPQNQWTHVAATWFTPTIQLYVNGNLVGATPDAGTTTDIQPLLFGVGPGGSAPFFGQIDEIRIWNTPRSAAEIRSTMFQPLSGSETNLVGYWPFNEGSSQTTADASVNSNNGILGLTTGVESSDPTWVAASLAPLGNLITTYQYSVTGMWVGRASTASDGITTGLDIANVTSTPFLQDVGDDIVFGHNNVAFQGGVTANVVSPVEKRWARLWELDVNDVGGNGGNVDLTFDISDAGGVGTFSGSGSYYLLKRATGSNDNFTEVPLVGSPAISGDHITFRVSVANLGSEFTLGATASSPTAVAVEQVTANSAMANSVPWMLTALVAAVAGGGVAIVVRRNRRSA